MQKPWWRKNEIDKNEIEVKRYKMTLEAILEFIQLMPADAFQKLDKLNYTTEDYTLKQFHWWVAKRIDETDPKHNSWGAR